MANDNFRLLRTIQAVKNGDYKIEVIGHRLVTLGAHTGHVYETVALCHDETWAAAIASALSKDTPA